MSENPLISVQSISRHFRMGQEVVRALDSISMEVQAGDFLGVSGSSGSGKSTLLYLLGGLDRPSNGHIWVKGEDISGLDEDGLAQYRQTMIGFIFQMFNLIPSLSALENVEFPMLFAGIPPQERHNRAVHLLQVVGLEDRMSHRPTELSGGQQQRVAIARSLVNNPAIILADEPTGNLDSRSGTEVMALLKQLNEQGRTLLVVSHDLAVIALTSHHIRLQDGQIVNGTPPN